MVSSLTPCLSQVFRLADDRGEAPGAKSSAHLRNHAERAGMVATLGNFQIGGIARGGEHARGEFMVQVRLRGRARGVRSGLFCASLQHAFQLIRADHVIDFRDLLLNLLPVALHQASGHHQFLGGAEFLVLGHFQNGVDGFLLGGFDEGASIDDDDVSLVGARRKLDTPGAPGFPASPRCPQDSWDSPDSPFRLWA